ncbi:FhaA domain-containing protein [Demetria terragena]|uniref:FhaA domain-containing protein n=1 Tax=Demetria terragena TaxID=63959 RepID=UPI0003758453|nr:DUF3662 and FHA domain-containing protein [Demetria terragena]
MGLFDKIERRLEQTVNGAFAKAFRSEVQPVEIASSMRRAMDNRASSISKNQRPIVPNVFDVELSSNDFERLTAYRAELADELIASAMEHADTQRYTAGGPVAVTFTENTELETGIFHVRPSTAKKVEGLEAVRPAAPEGHDEPESAAPATESAAPVPGRLGDAYAQELADEQPRSAPAPRATTQHAPPPPRPKVAKSRPWLDLDGERYPLLSARTTIGRDDSADIILDDPGISRHHSELRVTFDGPHLVVTLNDLNSTNGTYVNGDPVTRARLLDEDRITIGRTTFTIRMGGRR